MKNADLAIVGNGSIALYTAILIKQTHHNINVCIIGDKNHPFSASLAAGAMHAVYCEIEESFETNFNERLIFELGLEARKLWSDFFERFNLTNLITANSTIMYKRKSGTLFEHANFDICSKVAEQNGVLEEISKTELNKVFAGKLKKDEVVAKKFVGEFSFDARELILQLTNIASSIGVSFLHQEAVSVKNTKDRALVNLADGKTHEFGKVVVAAGSNSSQLLAENHKIIPIYSGVGSALILDSLPSSYQDIDSVVRTPNRGGAQCGLHLVPNNKNTLYLGAGNYISKDKPAHRAETIRYLINLCEDEIVGRQFMYKAKTEFCLGARPRSLDGLPLLGSSLEYPNIFIASGNYRVGLTLAPYIAAQALLWFEDRELDAKTRHWKPDRDLASYSSMTAAINYFASSRISNLIEHKLLADNELSIEQKKSELAEQVISKNEEIVKMYNLPPGFVVDPDMYGVFD